MIKFVNFRRDLSRVYGFVLPVTFATIRPKESIVPSHQMEGNEIKPARAAPPKPTPHRPHRPPPSVAAPILPSADPTLSNGTPPVPGRKPPPSGPPPPLPPRVDLGEEPKELVNSVKEKSSDDFTTKGSPKLKSKGRPEITIVSAKPMDSPAMIPSPSTLSQPAPEVPKISPKQSRKSKGREPPPRPKTRPVSELTLETDELEMGPVIPGEGTSVQVQSSQESDLNYVPVVPARKMQSHSMEDTSNLEVDTAEKESRPAPVEVDGVKEATLDNSGVSPVDAASTARKSRPTVITKPPKKTPVPCQDAEEKHRNEEQEEVKKEEKVIPDVNQGGKPPPPAKKPKPAVKAKPPSSAETPSKESTEEKKMDGAVAPKPKARPTVILPAKPPKVSGAPKLADSETAKDEDEGKAQVKSSRPTVILPTKDKSSEARKASESESVKDKEEGPVQVKSPKPTVILAAKPPKMTETSKPSDGSREDEQAEVKPSSAEAAEKVRDKGNDGELTAAPRSVKAKRVPTVIRAPRPEGQGTGEVRKPPQRPQRGPSVRKAAPPRPVRVPAEENEGQDNATSRSQEESDAGGSAQVKERKQEKKAKPPRPVSMPGLKEYENLLNVQKLHDTESPVEGETALNRKGSRKRPPPPRPPAAEPDRRGVEPTPEAIDKANVPDEKSTEKHRPPAPRPPTSEPVRVEVEPTPETRDKMDDKGSKPKGKSKPPRPSSRVLESKPSKHSPEEMEETHMDKPKPARPALVAPKVDAGSRNDAETRTVGETSADNHVKGTSDARDSEGHGKVSSKSKPRPPRPTSSSVSSKNKPQRPSGPTTQPSRKTKEKAALTQVSTVCETYIEPSAIALYDYEPAAIDDLAFSAGDEIVLVKRLDSEWYIGRLGDQQGMFPVKFVEIIEDLPLEVTEDTQPVTAPASSPLDVMALYDFDGNERDGELVFTAGEMIHVMEKINDDWLRGEYCGRTGAFPSNFVDISSDIISELPLSEENVTTPKSNVETTSSDSGRGLRCKALFDYNSDELGDLSFNTGDVIKVHKKIGEDWIEGELNGRVGMFPSAYVKMVEDENMQGRKESEQEETKASTVEVGTAKYDFTGSASDELSFNKGDKIEITEIISDDWLRGKLGGREGMFPRTFVQLSKESVREAQPVKKVVQITPKGKALFDFDGEYEDELSFKVNDDIVLLERVNEEWLKGQVNGRVGRFPAAFVKILTPLP